MSPICCLVFYLYYISMFFIFAAGANSRWQTVRGRFAALNSFLMSCRCRYAPEGPAPAAHFGNGCSDLVIVHDCSRLQYVKHLYRCTIPDADQVWLLYSVVASLSNCSTVLSFVLTDYVRKSKNSGSF